jgi:hypothetical protein
MVVRNMAKSRGSFLHEGPMPMPVISGGARSGSRAARQRNVAPERVRDEIDRMPQLEQGADTMVLAEGSAPGSKNGSGAIIRMRMLKARQL